MKGVSVRRIPVGRPCAGIVVIRLHYSADPTMTDARVAHLKSKYPDLNTWNQEMEIDQRARSGQRIFTDWDGTVNLVEPLCLPSKLQPSEWTKWLMCDPHPRTPWAFVWLAANRRGELAVIWSEWKSDKGPTDYIAAAEMLNKADVLFGKPFRRVMDPAGKAWDADVNTDFFEAFRKAKDKTGKKIGVLFQPAKKNFEYNGYKLINQALKPHEYVIDDKLVVRPRLTIWRGAGDNNKLAERLEMARWAEWKTARDDKDPPEKPEMKDLHLIDCLSMGMLEGARFVEPYLVQEQQKRDLNTVIAHNSDRGFMEST